MEDLGLGLRGRGRTREGEEKRKKLVFYRLETIKEPKTRDIDFQVRSIRKKIQSIRVHPEFPDLDPEYPGSPGSRTLKLNWSQFLTRFATE